MLQQDDSLSGNGVRLKSFCSQHSNNSFQILRYLLPLGKQFAEGNYGQLPFFQHPHTVLTRNQTAFEQECGVGCRVAVPSQGDPVVAITCISHPSSQATAKAQAAAPAAELQLEGVTGDGEGLEGELEGDLAANPSAETGPSLNTGGMLACVLFYLRLACSYYKT